MAAEAAPDRPRQIGLVRAGLGWLLLGLGAIALLLASFVFWVNRAIFDTDRFTSSVNTALSAPEARDRISSVLAQSVDRLLDPQTRIKGDLPPNLAFAAPIIDRQFESLLADMIRDLMAS